MNMYVNQFRSQINLTSIIIYQNEIRSTIFADAKQELEP